MSDGVPRHPDDKTMAAFVEGLLDAPRQAEVTSHLRDCPDCRRVVAETAAFEREESAARTMPGKSGGLKPAAPWWRWLAAAAVLAAIGIAVPLVRWNESRRAPLAHLIAAAPAESRMIEARIARFPWARLQPPARGWAMPDPAQLKLAGAAGDVLEKTARATTPDALHARGIAYVLIDRYDEGIAALEQAAHASNDATMWSDLAAARSALAEEHPSQLPLALADADHALRLDSSLAEAHFNRALILERIGVREQARAEWQRYLELDPSSEWSLEARAHLHRLAGNDAKFDPAALQQAPDSYVRRFPQEARTWGEGPMLAEWADAEVAGENARASQRLDFIRAIAAALAATNGEHLLGDAVAAIDRARGNARVSLANGQRLYRDGRIAYSRREAGNAEQKFRAAAELFATGGSPMESVARYFAANAAFDQNRGDEARAALLALQSRVDANRHRALDAQIRWELAVLANSTGDWGAATRNADAAAAICRDLGERTNAAFLDSVAAHAYEWIGDSDRAWRRRASALDGLRGENDRARRSANLQMAAATLASVDRVAAAIAVMNLAMAEVGDANPVLASRALAERARLDERAGDMEGARRALADARTAAGRITDRALRDTAEAHIALAEGVVRSASDARASLADFDRAIAFFETRPFAAFLPDARLQRGRAWRRAGNDEMALADYAAALREIDQQRSTILDPELRLAFLDTASQVIAETIDVRLARGENETALAVADGARALRGDARDPRPVVPPGVAAIEYAVLPRAIAIFSVTGGNVAVERIAIAREELRNRISALNDDLQRRRDIGSDSAALYQLLIAPVASRLAGAGELVIIPDQQLHAVPFAALYDAQRRRYLVEDFPLRIAPSLAGAARVAAGALTPATVLADPATPAWPPLKKSRDEARRVAAIHGAGLFIGDDATRVRFTESVTSSALVHFAGHADSTASESYGALLFAGGETLDTSEVARLDLARHPLIVLAACGTFRGDPLHVAGMPSLARAFLIAGARGVVGTLWEVDDDVAAALFLRLHEHLHAGVSPADALRMAQLEMLHSGDAHLAAPASWAPAALISNG